MPGVYRTWGRADGTYEDLGAQDAAIETLGAWTSPSTGITWPSGWRILATGLDLTLQLEPLLPDQELDTRASTGLVYWEGAVDIAGSRHGQAVRGRGYVQLTGYRPGS